MHLVITVHAFGFRGNDAAFDASSNTKFRTGTTSVAGITNDRVAGISNVSTIGDFSYYWKLYFNTWR